MNPNHIPPGNGPFVPNRINDVCDIPPHLMAAAIEEAAWRAEPVIFRDAEPKEYSAPRFKTARELLDSQEEETPPFLLENLIPAVGLSAIVGIPDSGKSQFTRHLGLAVLSESSFLGHALHAPRKRCLFVITEESEQDIGASLRKQITGWDTAIEALRSMKIIAMNDLTSEELIALIRNQLTKEPADLVVIDAFGDIFGGKDANNAAQMREALKPFHTLAMQHSTAILFVYHIRKGSYKLSPDHSQVMNSAAFVQKCRSIIDLRPDAQDPLTKYLTITKANGISSTKKQYASVLRFNEETLRFTNTGQQKKVSEINAEIMGEEDERKREVFELFRKGMSYRQIEEATGISKTTTQKWCKKAEILRDGQKNEIDDNEE